MAVKIRLRRMGRKKAPHYRIVVADSTAPRDGRFVESIGYYKPLESPARLVVDLDRVDYWVGQGASPSDTVKSLVEKARKGGDATVALGEVDAAAAKEKKAEEAARKRAEAEAKAKAEAEAKAKAEAEAKAQAEAEAKAQAEAEAAAAADGEAAEAEATGDETSEG
jgi:small subunit ribosomal protein S16